MPLILSQLLRMAAIVKGTQLGGRGLTALIGKLFGGAVAKKGAEAAGRAALASIAPRAGAKLASSAVGPSITKAAQAVQGRAPGWLGKHLPGSASEMGQGLTSGLGGVGATGLSVLPFMMFMGGEDDQQLEHDGNVDLTAYMAQQMPNAGRNQAGVQRAYDEAQIRDMLMELMSTQDANRIMSGTRRMI